MPTRSSKDHDFTRAALRTVEQTIGEKWDGSPLDKPTKNAAAVALCHEIIGKVWSILAYAERASGPDADPEYDTNNMYDTIRRLTGERERCAKIAEESVRTMPDNVAGYSTTTMRGAITVVSAYVAAKIRSGE